MILNICWINIQNAPRIVKVWLGLSKLVQSPGKSYSNSQAWPLRTLTLLLRKRHSNSIHIILFLSWYCTFSIWIHQFALHWWMLQKITDMIWFKTLVPFHFYLQTLSVCPIRIALILNTTILKIKSISNSSSEPKWHYKL